MASSFRSATFHAPTSTSFLLFIYVLDDPPTGRKQRYLSSNTYSSSLSILVAKTCYSLKSEVSHRGFCDVRCHLDAETGGWETGHIGLLGRTDNTPGQQPSSRVLWILQVACGDLKINPRRLFLSKPGGVEEYISGGRRMTVELAKKPFILLVSTPPLRGDRGHSGRLTCPTHCGWLAPIQPEMGHPSPYICLDHSTGEVPAIGCESPGILCWPFRLPLPGEAIRHVFDFWERVPLYQVFSPTMTMHASPSAGFRLRFEPSFQ